MAIAARDIARACEALNRHEGLTPAARRVGVEIINHIDRRTGKAWPSEARLADILGYTTRSIRRAKVELARLGVLSWRRRGPHRTPVYTIAWATLTGIARSLKERLKVATARFRKTTRAVGSPAPVEKRHHDRTFQSAYLPQSFSLRGIGRKTETVLPESLLNSRAHTRLWTAIRGLEASLVAQIIARMSENIEAEAVRAERFRPGSGLQTLAGLLRS